MPTVTVVLEEPDNIFPSHPPAKKVHTKVQNILESEEEQREAIVQSIRHGRHSHRHHPHRHHHHRDTCDPKKAPQQHHPGSSTTTTRTKSRIKKSTKSQPPPPPYPIILRNGSLELFKPDEMFNEDLKPFQCSKQRFQLTKELNFGQGHRGNHHYMFGDVVHNHHNSGQQGSGSGSTSSVLKPLLAPVPRNTVIELINETSPRNSHHHKGRSFFQKFLRSITPRGGGGNGKGSRPSSKSESPLRRSSQSQKTHASTQTIYEPPQPPDPAPNYGVERKYSSMFRLVLSRIDSLRAIVHKGVPKSTHNLDLDLHENEEESEEEEEEDSGVETSQDDDELSSGSNSQPSLAPGSQDSVDTVIEVTKESEQALVAVVSRSELESEEIALEVPETLTSTSCSSSYSSSSSLEEEELIESGSTVTLLRRKTLLSPEPSHECIGIDMEYLSGRANVQDDLEDAVECNSFFDNDDESNLIVETSSSRVKTKGKSSEIQRSASEASRILPTNRMITIDPRPVSSLADLIRKNSSYFRNIFKKAKDWGFIKFRDPTLLKNDAIPLASENATKNCLFKQSVQANSWINRKNAFRKKHKIFRTMRRKSFSQTPGTKEGPSPTPRFIMTNLILCPSLIGNESGRKRKFTERRVLVNPMGNVENIDECPKGRRSVTRKYPKAVATASAKLGQNGQDHTLAPTGTKSSGRRLKRKFPEPRKMLLSINLVDPVEEEVAQE